jgi:hypothetical protein
MELRDGTTVMASVPSIVCWESSEHRALVGASIASLIVYVMGVPAVTFGTVLYARRKDLLKNEKVMLGLGYWYTWYSTFRHWPSFSRACLSPSTLVHAFGAVVQNPTLHGGPSWSTFDKWD